jgi:hypothetical protein
MPKKIIWTELARADLRAIDQRTALRILHALARLLPPGKAMSNVFKILSPRSFDYG